MLLTALLVSASDAGWWNRLPMPSIASPERLRASTLMKNGRSAADAEKAVQLLEGCLHQSPKDPKLALECAIALNAVMRIKTHSNTLHITRMLDTPEHKKVWRRYGSRALELASAAKAQYPNDETALVAYADAYFFANSVKGVLAAATTGSGLKFKGNSKELIRKCERADGGVGHAYLGAFFLMAPWPLHNANKAEEHLMAAHRIVPSRRNCYYLGVLNYRLGRVANAIPYFEASVKARCNSASEQDFGGWVLQEAKLAIQECEQQLRSEQS